MQKFFQDWNDSRIERERMKEELRSICIDVSDRVAKETSMRVAKEIAQETVTQTLIKLGINPKEDPTERQRDNAFLRDLRKGYVSLKIKIVVATVLGLLGSVGSAIFLGLMELGKFPTLPN